MRLAEWKFLFLFIPLLGLAFHMKLKHGIKTGIRFNLLYRLKQRNSIFLLNLPLYTRMLLLVIIAASLLRPQLVRTNRSFSSEGINIMLMLDVSGSMQAQDFKPNRFEAARTVLEEFISGRKNDRIGLVVFSGEAYTACPLTVDYDVLIDFLKNVSMGRIADGTAIGDGLGVAISHLRHAPGKTKIVILLTDGENNAGSITPIMASDWAADDEIKVYTIGAGSREGANVPVRDQFGRAVAYIKTKLDEKLLSDIADKTGAKFYMATDNQKLSEIYSEIDELEKTEVKTRLYYNYEELFPWLIWTALFLFAILFLTEEYMLRIP